MRLWRRACGALKDRNSIIIASLGRRTSLRHPDIEAAVIKATSHDDSALDYRSTQKVVSWVRLSQAYLKPLLWAIWMRMEKTRSWVVALKGLILMHAVFACKVPAAQKIGRLPFDLSNFRDGHGSAAKTWGFNAFIRAYYTFLDHKSTFVSMDMHEQKSRTEEQPITQDLVRIQKLQELLDLLLQIKPQTEKIMTVLVLEAMDCVILEVYDVYSKVCNAMAKVLVKIHSAGKIQASWALKLVQKATVQSEELALYFEYCREIGVLRASECPTIKRLPEEGIRELERIINGVPDRICSRKDDQVVPEQEKEPMEEEKVLKCGLQTIITQEWELFDEDLAELKEEITSPGLRKENPFDSPLIRLDDDQPYGNCPRDLPDLISFL
ncbi:putative clathrin assembly protein At1g25240 [Diospyros lotus]|uniref:putative clathrin assembly protein At1g25240 n=1 Tax=Diospyros lotus TaxID=55363 RepID=UPI002252B756|nr:putative clathrin assembly protein At1g25240 [Diospyros lotus]